MDTEIKIKKYAYPNSKGEGLLFFTSWKRCMSATHFSHEGYSAHAVRCAAKAFCGPKTISSVELFVENVPQPPPPSPPPALPTVVQ